MFSTKDIIVTPNQEEVVLIPDEATNLNQAPPPQ